MHPQVSTPKMQSCLVIPFGKIQLTQALALLCYFEALQNRDLSPGSLDLELAINSTHGDASTSFEISHLKGSLLAFRSSEFPCFSLAAMRLFPQVAIGRLMAKNGLNNNHMKSLTRWPTVK